MFALVCRYQFSNTEAVIVRFAKYKIKAFAEHTSILSGSVSDKKPECNNNNNNDKKDVPKTVGQVQMQSLDNAKSDDEGAEYDLQKGTLQKPFLDGVVFFQPDQTKNAVHQAHGAQDWKDVDAAYDSGKYNKADNDDADDGDISFQIKIFVFFHNNPF